MWWIKIRDEICLFCVDGRQHGIQWQHMSPLWDNNGQRLTFPISQNLSQTWDKCGLWPNMSCDFGMLCKYQLGGDNRLSPLWDKLSVCDVILRQFICLNVGQLCDFYSRSLSPSMDKNWSCYVILYVYHDFMI